MATRNLILGTFAVAAVATIGWLAYDRGWLAAGPGEVANAAETAKAVPVELARIERGRLVERRTFSGTLVPRAQFTVASKVAGRIASLHVEIGDEVTPDAVVAVLDDDEFAQAVAETKAGLDVAKAELSRARSALQVEKRNFERVTGLQKIDIASASEKDVAIASLEASEAEVKVSAARVARAEALLAAAEVRQQYTTVRATWSDGDTPRVVSERYLDEGATVSVNEPLVTVVDIASLRAILYVTERYFPRLAIDQPARVRNDAWPGRDFVGRIARIAPVFEEASRQMRVEVAIDNPDRALRPGMFVRVQIDLGSTDEAVIVPEEALAVRDQRQGVFVVGADDRALFVPVELGIRAGSRVQVFGEGLTGRVVTLGQQLLDDGTQVRVPAPLVPAADPTDATAANRE